VKGCQYFSLREHETTKQPGDFNKIGWHHRDKRKRTGQMKDLTYAQLYKTLEMNCKYFGTILSSCTILKHIVLAHFCIFKYYFDIIQLLVKSVAPSNFGLWFVRPIVTSQLLLRWAFSSCSKITFPHMTAILNKMNENLCRSNFLFVFSSIHPFSIPAQCISGVGGLEPIPAVICAKGRVHPGQVAKPLISNFHPHLNGSQK